MTLNHVNGGSLIIFSASSVPSLARGTYSLMYIYIYIYISPDRPALWAVRLWESNRWFLDDGRTLFKWQVIYNNHKEEGKWKGGRDGPCRNILIKQLHIFSTVHAAQYARQDSIISKIL